MEIADRVLSILERVFYALDRYLLREMIENLINKERKSINIDSQDYLDIIKLIHKYDVDIVKFECNVAQLPPGLFKISRIVDWYYWRFQEDANSIQLPRWMFRLNSRILIPYEWTHKLVKIPNCCDWISLYVNDWVVDSVKCGYVAFAYLYGLDYKIH